MHYAEQHPDLVQSLVLRGISMLRDAGHSSHEPGIPRARTAALPRAGSWPGGMKTTSSASSRVSLQESLATLINRMLTHVFLLVHSLPTGSYPPSTSRMARWASPNEASAMALFAASQLAMAMRPKGSRARSQGRSCTGHSLVHATSSVVGS